MTPPAPATVSALLVGGIAPLGDKGVPSGIDKRAVARPLRIAREGLDGDAQGDRRNHGGPDKAVHHYPFEHYARWREAIGPHPLLERPGAFGENVSTSGLSEATVALGDVFRLGSATLAVSQGRQPCFRLNLRFGRPDMARRVQESGRTGWYYRVVEEGVAAPGDALVLIDRPLPDWPLTRLLATLYGDMLNRDELAAMAALSALPENWRRLAARRLENGRVEDWRKRLTGEEAGGQGA
ncbi:MAG: MOSC domain-containing protein [Hyphomicrobiales bacterium]|nr:MAG: MOSC domain-containing protein [Hyphomicrobiales bacterium]